MKPLLIIVAGIAVLAGFVLWINSVNGRQQEVARAEAIEDVRQANRAEECRKKAATGDLDDLQRELCDLTFYLEREASRSSTPSE